MRRRGRDGKHDLALSRRRRLQLLHYLPGIFTSAGLIFNFKIRERMGSKTTATHLDGTIPSGGLAGAVGLLVRDALTDKGPSCGLVFACVMQCPCGDKCVILLDLP